MTKNSTGVKSGANFFRISSIYYTEDTYEVSYDETSYSAYGIDISHTIPYDETNDIMRQLLVPYNGEK